MGKLGLVFAGQGSQYVGMGLDYIDQFPMFKGKEILASHALGYDVRSVIEGKTGDLNQTFYTQPLILLSTLLAYEALKTLGLKPDGVLGFSLGEYSAFYAAEIFPFDAIMKLISERARLMEQCAREHPGKMAAILGLDQPTVQSVCEQASSDGLVLPVNYNSPVQIVISGEALAVQKAIEIAKSKGAKRAIELNVSGAFHSPLMNSAGQGLERYLNTIQFHEPKLPIYLNTTAKPLVFEKLKQEMVKQIQSPVLFEQSIVQMVQDGYTHFIEIGPGTVLSGLIKKINISLEVTHLDKASELEALKGWIIEHGFNQ
jgi:[acyl-carrier-protein] S-malonyltransferase